MWLTIVSHTVDNHQHILYIHTILKFVLIYTGFFVMIFEKTDEIFREYLQAARSLAIFFVKRVKGFWLNDSHLYAYTKDK